MIYPSPIIRCYPTSEAVTRLFLLFAEQQDLVITRAEDHHITVSCSLGAIRFWSANKYYAWAMDGVYTDTRGNSQKWNKELPSRWAVRCLAKKISQLMFQPCTKETK